MMDLRLERCGHMKRFTLRLENDLHDLLQKIAAHEHRSMQEQVIHILTQWIAEHWMPRNIK